MFVKVNQSIIKTSLTPESSADRTQRRNMIMCHSSFVDREPGHRGARVVKPDQIGEIQLISGMLKLFG